MRILFNVNQVLKIIFHQILVWKTITANWKLFDEVNFKHYNNIIPNLTSQMVVEVRETAIVNIVHSEI